MIGRSSAVLLLAVTPVLATLPVGAVTPTGALPAYASDLRATDADLAVRISDAPSRGVPGRQVVTATVVNRGPGRASGVTLRFAGRVDSEAVDPETVRFCAQRRSPAPAAAPAASAAPPVLAPSLTAEVNGACALPDLAPGRSYGLRSVLRGRVHTIGPVGEMTVVVRHAGADPSLADNSATTRLGFPGPAAYRLYTRSWDGPADPAGTVGAVPPGRTGDLRFEVGNAGRDPVNGFTVTIQLPRRVAFAEERPGCAYTRDRRGATCTYGDLPLVPAEADTDPTDRRYSALRFRHAFAVDRAAPARARLDDGLLRVEPMVTGYLPPPVTRLPADVTGLRARDFAAEDDLDRFVVFTAGSVGDGAGRGDPGGDPGGVATGDAGAASPDGLPVTGAPIGLLGAVGLGVAVAGLGLLLIGRWRARHPGR